MLPPLGVLVVLFGPQQKTEPSPIHFSGPQPFGPGGKQPLTIYAFVSERHQPCAPVHIKPPGFPETRASAYLSSGGPLEVSLYE